MAYTWKVALEKIGKRINDNVEEVSSIANKSSNLALSSNTNKNLNIRRDSNKVWYTYTLPDKLSDFPIRIITDGYNFRYNFDITKYKNTGGRTFYVSPDGTTKPEVDGLDESKPISFSVCLTRDNEYALKDGDTIIFLDGIYREMPKFATLENKIKNNINLIAKNKGKVVYTSISSPLSYTKNDTYNKVYQADRTSVLKVVNLLDENDFDSHTPLEKVNSIEECNNKEGSFYSDGSKLYVHLFFDKVPTYENTFVLLNYNKPLIDVDSETQNINLYIEGINFFGGTPATMLFSSSTTFKESSVYAKNCNFLYAYDSALGKDAVSIRGAKNAYFVGCSAQHSSKDGFNYHSFNGVIPNFIEIDCKGANNGIDGIALSKDEKWQNGSTSHDGVKGIRINGVYYNNFGGNVTDVHDDTVTLNISCKAFDSAYNGDMEDVNADFLAQQSGTTMYLENCIAFGSKTSVSAVKGSKIKIRNCSLENGIGSNVTDI